MYALTQVIFNYLPSNYFLFFQNDFWMGLLLTSAVVLAIGVFVLLIRYAATVANWLGLDRGFDEERMEFGQLNVHGLISTAVIIIGGFMVVDYLPNLLYNGFVAFKEEVAVKGLSNEADTFDSERVYFHLSMAALNVIIGSLLLTNYRNVANWLVSLNLKNDVKL